MRQLHRLYQNPAIPNGRYFVRIEELKAEPAQHKRPFIEIVFRVSDLHSARGGTELYCPIHPTPGADSIAEGFLQAFDLTPKNVGKAVGRYARLIVKSCTYGSTEYSAVRFCPQRECDYADVCHRRSESTPKWAV